MPETLKQLLKRYVEEDTYSFQDFKVLEVNSVGLELETPLHMACGRNAMEDVALLLAAGANVNAQTDIGTTPLMIAALENSPQLVRMLLEAGADVSLKSDFGSSALSLAEAIPNSEEVVELLRSRSA
jgi:ankyrin repeat protein